jgi:hypothetical protein
MLGDMLDSRLLRIDAKSSSSVAISPTKYFSACHVQFSHFKKSYLRLNIRYPIYWESEFIERYLGFFKKPQKAELALQQEK